MPSGRPSTCDCLSALARGQIGRADRARMSLAEESCAGEKKGSADLAGPRTNQVRLRWRCPHCLSLYLEAGREKGFPPVVKEAERG